MTMAAMEAVAVAALPCRPLQEAGVVLMALADEMDGMAGFDDAML